MGGRIKVQDLIEGERNGVAFLCVGNSTRSQMAEGFARFLGPSDVAVFSAGSVPTEVNPFAVRAMKEVGIDISKHRSKDVKDLPLQRIAVAVTLCEEDECPVLPGHVQRLAWPLTDPAAEGENETDRLHAFRRVRDQIRELVSSLF
jgi:arsenate reductase